MMNVIFGAKSGKFTLHFAWFAGKKRVWKAFSVPADKPKACWPILRKMIRLHGEPLTVMTSSSMDFPHEEDVTHAQVKALWLELNASW